jgi:hypothetical protein
MRLLDPKSIITFLLSVAFIAVQGVHLHVLFTLIALAIAFKEYNFTSVRELNQMLLLGSYQFALLLYSYYLNNSEPINSYFLHLRLLLEVLLLSAIIIKKWKEYFLRISQYLTIWSAFYLIRATFFPSLGDGDYLAFSTVDSTYIVASMLFSVRLYSHFGGSAFKILTATNIAFCVVAIFGGYTDSRGPILSIALYIILIYPKILVVTPLLWFLDIGDRFSRIIKAADIFLSGDGGGTLNARISLWSDIIAAIIDFPFGLGFGGYQNLDTWAIGRIGNIESFLFEVLATGGGLYTAYMVIILLKGLTTMVKVRSGGSIFVISMLPSILSNPFGLSHVFILLITSEFLYSRSFNMIQCRSLDIAEKKLAVH